MINVNSNVKNRFHTTTRKVINHYLFSFRISERQHGPLFEVSGKLRPDGPNCSFALAPGKHRGVRG